MKSADDHRWSPRGILMAHHSGVPAGVAWGDSSRMLWTPICDGYNHFGKCMCPSSD